MLFGGQRGFGLAQAHVVDRGPLDLQGQPISLPFLDLALQLGYLLRIDLRGRRQRREKGRWRAIYGHGLRKMAEWAEDARKGLWRGEALRMRGMAFRNVVGQQGIWRWHHTAFDGYIYLNRRTRESEAWLEWECRRPKPFETCKLHVSGLTPNRKQSVLMIRISADSGKTWQEVGQMKYPARYSRETFDITKLVAGKTSFRIRIATPKGSECRIADIEVMERLRQ